MITRRRFLATSATMAAFAGLRPAWAKGANSSPNLEFPTQARERIAVASYPFRDFIVDPANAASSVQKIALKDFAAHVVARFKVNKVELWSGHFPSTDPKYLAEMRAAVEAAHGAVVNMAVDGEHSPFGEDSKERDAAVAFSKQWIDVAAAIGSSSIRTNLPPPTNSKPDPSVGVERLKRVVEYASTKNVVINLENDNPVSEDPFLLIKMIEQVDSPWLHALPDFANSLTANDEEYAYCGVNAMFGHAYNICHVKEYEASDNGKSVHVDLAKTFGFMREHHYRGYCSMEFDSAGDPYQGTADLIEKAEKFLG